MRRLLSLDGIRYAAFLTVFLVIVGGAAYAAIEKNQSLSTWDGIWWSINTVTTLGLAGPPETDAGRAIAIVVMGIGIGFVALLTAYVADRFIRQDVGEPVEEREDRVLVELQSISDRLAAVERRLDRD
jgi:voltage-gated potassium channel